MDISADYVEELEDRIAELEQISADQDDTIVDLRYDLEISEENRAEQERRIDDLATALEELIEATESAVGNIDSATRDARYYLRF